MAVCPQQAAEHPNGQGVHGAAAQLRHPILCGPPGAPSVTDHFGKSDSKNKLSSRVIETYANSPIGQSAERGAIPLEYACTADALEGEWGRGRS